MKYQGKITDPKDLVTKEYIDDKTAPVETSPTAAAYAVDDLLIYNGVLYRVTQAISIGGTLTVGTNITATNLDTERDRLKSALDNVANAKQNKYTPNDTVLVTMPEGTQGVFVMATKDGWICIKAGASASPFTVTGFIRDNTSSYVGVSFNVSFNAYSDGPVTMIPCLAGRQYYIEANGHKGLAIYQC